MCSSAYSQQQTQGGVFIFYKEALRQIHIDAETSATSGDMADLKWVVRETAGRGSPSPMSRTGGFSTFTKTLEKGALRARTPMLDRNQMAETMRNARVTLGTLEQMDARAREDIAESERPSHTADPLQRRSITACENPIEDPGADAEVNSDYISQPAESARGSARLIEANLHEIRRGSVDLSGGAVPAADMTTRQAGTAMDKMSRTMT